MTYEVLLKQSEEGFAVWVPTLPGCASQGDTEEEALNNIRDAIAEYLTAIHELHSAETGVFHRTVQVQARSA
jgi:predicted RNase H-like HicB family nuclease